jgi:hypothetical protein
MTRMKRRKRMTRMIKMGRTMMKMTTMRRKVEELNVNALPAIQ